MQPEKVTPAPEHRTLSSQHHSRLLSQYPPRPANPQHQDTRSCVAVSFPIWDTTTADRLEASCPMLHHQSTNTAEGMGVICAHAFTW
eukprot:983017-Pelagomonas_calceolata.AAC.2